MLLSVQNPHSCLCCCANSIYISCDGEFIVFRGTVFANSGTSVAAVRHENTAQVCNLQSTNANHSFVRSNPKTNASRSLAALSINTRRIVHVD